MNKIFKYDFNPETREVELPLEHTILRIDHVDDGFYKGDFLWAIVDAEAPNCRQVVNYKLGYSRNPRPPQSLYREELRVMEKQYVKYTPVYAEEDTGKMYVYSPDHSYPKNGPFKVAVYKTGQEIDLPLDKLRYLGLCKLRIVQELGLYVFWAHE